MSSTGSRQTICVFHDRAQIRHARSLVTAIEAEGFTAWLADRDSVGNWREDVTAVLRRSDCMGAIVIWSENAVENPIVLGEAEATVREKRRLLSVVLDGGYAPLGFESTPRVLMQNWDGSDSSALDEVRRKLVRMAASVAQMGSRIHEFIVEGRKLLCPAFVFSVSSFETQLSPAKTLELLKLFTPPAILLSAYDVLGTSDPSSDVTPSTELLRELQAKDTTIFLDSGNYEAYRLQDLFWQRSPWLLREATSRLRCDVIFCHDRIIEAESLREIDITAVAAEILSDVERDTLAANGKAISPIVHAPRLRDGTFASQVLPELCAQVAKKKPPLIAVAERELGDGILERARRVRSIRRAIDRVSLNQPLHILGTGNPLSIMILALAGGDVFDGLEWCRTVIDADTIRLHHFHQFDLLLSQRAQIQDEALREYLTTREEFLTAKAKAILHNLYFFQQFAKELATAHQQDSFDEMFERYLPGEYGRILRRINSEDRP